MYGTFLVLRRGVLRLDTVVLRPDIAVLRPDIVVLRPDIAVPGGADGGWENNGDCDAWAGLQSDERRWRMLLRPTTC